MRPTTLLLNLAVIALLTACTSDPLVPTATDQQSEQNLQLLAQKESEAERRIADHEAKILNHPNYQESTTRRTPPVYLPAGSVDGLQAAIDQAGPWGKVVVKAGLHIENQTVNITHPVRVVGEKNAVIQSNVVPTEDFASLPTTLTPSIFVNGADFVQIRNLTLVPDPIRGYGELAIAVNQSDYAYIRGNDIQQFANGVYAQDAEHILVLRNMAEGVISDGAPQILSAGFLHASGGFGAYFRNNSNDFNYGQFHCDANGLMWKNLGTNCLTSSLTLCKWAKLSLFPNGDTIGADISATQWLVINNQAENCGNSYDIFDGSNNNLLISNKATNSGVYDFLFSGDVVIPPFGLLPAVFDNTFIGGKYSGQLVKDCGINTTIFGANVVDPAVDPCP